MTTSGAEGISELVELVVSWGASMGVLTALYVLDERWMSEEQRERAWPTSTRRIAIVVFGVLAVPIHFVKTRGWIRGLALGVGAMLAAGALVDVAAWAVATALGFD